MLISFSYLQTLSPGHNQVLRQSIINATQFSVCMLVTQLCLTLCNSMDCSPPGSSIHGIFPGKNTRVDCHFFLQGIFPTQRSNPSLSHCRQTLLWAIREALYPILYPKVSLIHSLLLLHITIPAKALNYLWLGLPASDHLQPQIYLDHNLLKKHLPSTTEMILLKSKCDFINIWLKIHLIV